MALILLFYFPSKNIMLKTTKTFPIDSLFFLLCFQRKKHIQNNTLNKLNEKHNLHQEGLSAGGLIPL